jgi:very-short-patch-repair endonuclease
MPSGLKNASGQAGGEERVLVAVVRLFSDLERIRKERWYRIPVSARISPFGCRYLALYPTRSCGPMGGKIEYFAPIREVLPVRRRDLLPGEKDHPRAADFYWKVMVGSSRRLEPPVENLCRRRLVFAYTTLSRLHASRELGELFAVPPLEVILARNLRKTGWEFSPQYPVRDKGRIRYRIDFALFPEGSPIALECDHSRWHGKKKRLAADRARDRWLCRHGWRVIRLTEKELLSDGVEVLLREMLRESSLSAPRVSLS